MIDPILRVKDIHLNFGGVAALSGVITIDYFLPVLESATGAGYDKESLLRGGERIWNQERLFNLKAGLTTDLVLV